MSARVDFPILDLAGRPMAWPDLLTELTALEAAHPGRFVLRNSFWAQRSIPEEVTAGVHYQPTTAERWIVIGRAVYLTTEGAVAKNATNPPGAERRFTIVEVAPVADIVAFRTPPAIEDGFILSDRFTGLWKKIDQEKLQVTFRYGRIDATYDIRTGREIDASDRGNFPADVAAYINERMAKMPPPHKREKAAQAATQTASEVLPQPEATAPIVSAVTTPVNQKEDPMLDLSNPAVVAAARTTANNIKNSIGIPDIEGRRATLRASNLAVEKAYRKAEVEADEARRRLSDVKASLKDRAEELLNVVAEIRAEGTKPKYPSASAVQTALKAALKTDAAHVAIAAEIKQTDAAHKAASNDEAPAIKVVLAKKQEELAAREAAIGDALTAETVAETAFRYTTVDSKNAAAITARKTDPEYLAIKAEVGKAEQALYVAETALADAKSEQRALDRDWEMLKQEHTLAAARVNAFGGLDAPAPVPISTHAAPAAVA